MSGFTGICGRKACFKRRNSTWGGALRDDTKTTVKHTINGRPIRVKKYRRQKI